MQEQTKKEKKRESFMQSERYNAIVLFNTLATQF